MCKYKLSTGHVQQYDIGKKYIMAINACITRYNRWSIAMDLDWMRFVHSLLQQLFLPKNWFQVWHI
jgi:hypothetical protein